MFAKSPLLLFVLNKTAPSLFLSRKQPIPLFFFFFGSFIGYCLARVEPPTSQIANKGHVHLGDLGIQINEPKSIKAWHNLHASYPEDVFQQCFDKNLWIPLWVFNRIKS